VEVGAGVIEVMVLIGREIDGISIGTGSTELAVTIACAEVVEVTFNKK
jgi:hypothetical protein